MKPANFKESNRTLQPSGRIYSENVSEVTLLHVWSDDEQCLSCWQMSFKERLLALLFGRVWVAMLSGRSQPPLYIKVGKTYLKKTDDCR